MKDDFD